MRRAAALLTLAAVAFGGSVPGSAAANHGPDQTVTVVLAPADRPALHAAAARSGGERNTRVGALRPSADSRGAVRRTLARLGLDVVRENAWTVSARGPADVVRAAFGSARASRPTSRFAQPLPSLPVALRGVATVALGGDESRPAVRPLGVPGVGYDGPPLRQAYAASADTGPGATTMTVATIQFSGWNASDLTTYAQAAISPSADPVGTGQYTAVSVDGANPATPDGRGGDLEVALDQEALLAVAPATRQRVYFAPNSLAGFVDAIAAVAADAASTSPEHRIAALSISWGACEDVWTGGGADLSVVTAMQDMLADAVASGVTVFAATGDWGVDDCGYVDTPSVDFPASSPYVVAVGGTTLRNPTTSPTETGWSGSGGGKSAIFAGPAYQAAAGIRDPRRLLPDIAVNADPATGFALYSSNSQQWTGGWSSTRAVGGTSLAAPLSAGMLTALLARNGYARGLGHIHDELYSAPAAAFRDITSGSNGAGTMAGYYAHAGYDLVTGRGAPLWNTLAASLVGPPAAAARVTLASPVAPSPLVYSWSGRPAGSPITSYGVTITRTAGPATETVAQNTYDPAQTSVTGPGEPGWTYYLTVVATDSVGHASSGALARAAVPLDDFVFRYSSSWRRIARTGPYGGSYAKSGVRGASAVATATGRQYVLWVARHAYGGRADVYVDGRFVKVIDTYAPTTQFRYAIDVGTYSAGAHTVTVKARGDRNASARGTDVVLDALNAIS